MVASIGAEVLGSIGIGTVLLFFHNEQPLSSVFEDAGAIGSGPGGYLWAGFFGAVAFIGWTYVGFETAGSVAEETPRPRFDVPKAIILSLVAVAAVVSYASLALILAIPDFGAVLSGEVVDPVADTVTFQLGSGITKPLFVLFIIGFTASLLAIQTNCSRVMWAFARADVLPASGFLKKLSSGARLPVNTILTTGVIAAHPAHHDPVRGRLPDADLDGHRGLLPLVRDAVVAAMVTRLRGRWVQGEWNLGRWGMLVAIVASVWVVFEYFNIAWPRAEGVPWYQDWAVFLMTGIIAALGVLAYLLVRPKVLAAEDRLVADPSSVDWAATGAEREESQ